MAHTTSYDVFSGVSEEIRGLLWHMLKLLDEPSYEPSPESRTERAARLVSEYYGHTVNVYPGQHADACFDTCLVLSLKPEDPGDRTRRHLDFASALRTMRNHADTCRNTQRLVLITNEWWAPAFKDWQDTLDRLRREGREVYFVLLTGTRHFTPLQL